MVFSYLKNLSKFLPKVLVILLIFAWLFSGWPQIFNFPPKVEEAQAMAAPTLAAEGNLAVVTTGNLTVTLPAHQANDILIVTITAWVPNTTSGTNTIAAPSGWTKLLNDTVITSGIIDGEWAIFWKRATSSSETNPTFTRPTGWDTGTDTNWSGRAYTIRGAAGTGDPWDAAVKTSLYTAANGSLAAVTVSGNNRTVIHFLSYSDDALTSGQPTATGWTTGTQVKTTTGTDAAFNTLRKEDVNTSTGADSTTITAPAQGRYIYFGISFKPPAPTYNQSAYRFFDNANSTDVGTPLTAAQDTAATLSSSGAAFRLRMLLHVGSDYLPTNRETFKLQFGTSSGGNCSSSPPSSWLDVTNATAIAYNDNPTPVDGASLTANASDPTHGADTIVNQTYEELNNFTNSVAAIPSGQDGKWDFSLIDNGAPANTTYCLRVVKSDGTVLDTYTVIPEITTAAAAIVSVSVSDGEITYGIMLANTSKTTLSGSGELDDMQTATNDGNVTENFNIKGMDATGGGCTWTLASTNGTDQYVHQFCNDTDNDCSSPPTNYTALTTSYQSLDTGIPVDGRVQIQLRLTTPTQSSCFGQQSVDVTIQAVQAP